MFAEEQAALIIIYVSRLPEKQTNSPERERDPVFMLALMEVNKQMKRNTEFLLFQGSKAFHEVSAVVSAGYLKKQKERKKGSLNMLLVGLGENTCKPRSEPSLTLLFSIQKADQTEA